MFLFWWFQTAPFQVKVSFLLLEFSSKTYDILRLTKYEAESENVLYFYPRCETSKGKKCGGTTLPKPFLQLRFWSSLFTAQLSVEDQSKHSVVRWFHTQGAHFLTHTFSGFLAAESLGSLPKALRFGAVEGRKFRGWAYLGGGNPVSP